MEGKDKLLPKSSNSTKDKTSSKEKVYDFTLSIMKKLNDHNKIEMSKEEFNFKYQALITYCKQDTWAMVVILEALRKLIKEK